MSLNPEPAQPEVREAQNLPPKSYAAVAEEGLPEPDGIDGTKEHDRKTNGLSEPPDPEERRAQDLPPKSYAEAAEQGVPEANGVNDTKEHTAHTDGLSEPADPEERKAEDFSPKSYPDAVEENIPEANGVDGMKEQIARFEKLSEPAHPDERKARNLPPKSYAEAAEERAPQANGVNGINGTKRRVAQNVNNMKANGKINIPSADQVEEYEGEGQDDSPRTPVKHAHRPRRKSMQSNSSNGSPRRPSQNLDDIYAKHADGNGRTLTTVKSGDASEKDHRLDKSPKKRQKEGLVAGRQAGAGWEKSRIRWAPLNVPFKRRLQTLAVLMHTLSIAGTLTIFFFLCSVPLLWPILLPYVIYVLFSNAGTSGELSFRSERWRRSPIWSLFASYFPARLYRSQKLEPTRKYIFGYHPHGIISHGCWAAFATEALGFSQLFPGITNTVLTLDTNFRYPLYREYALRMGLASVSRESCENILSKGGRNGEGMGRAITIVIGGAREALEAQPGCLRLILQCRKGFIKLAIRTGADLVPVLAFGENDIYEQLDPQAHPKVHRIQLLIKKLMGFTVPLFHARGVFNYDVGMMPYRRPMNIVVGKPIEVCQEREPTAEYVNQVHEKYMQELRRLWDDWKDEFAKDRIAELEIIE